MLTPEQRTAICSEARTWLGTPYRGWSCEKGAGVDCGQLIYGVLRNCGHVPVLTLPRDYSLQVSQHRASTEYIDLVAKYMREIPESEVQPGDVVVYKLGLAYAHGGIVVGWPDTVIHAIGGNNRGVQHTHGKNTPKFNKHPRKFFTVK